MKFHLDLKMNMHRNIILIVVLCGCEIWSVTLREAHMVRVFENRVLRKMFGPKREEVTRNIFVDPWFIHSYSEIPPDYHQSKMYKSVMQYQTVNDIQIHNLLYIET
jgi:hypothetical protein